MKRSDKGIAGVIPRNTNLSRIAYGLDCPVHITNPFECKPDNTIASKEICKLTGDASVTCKSKFLVVALLNEKRDIKIDY